MSTSSEPSSLIVTNGTRRFFFLGDSTISIPSEEGAWGGGEDSARALPLPLFSNLRGGASSSESMTTTSRFSGSGLTLSGRKRGSGGVAGEATAGEAPRRSDGAGRGSSNKKPSAAVG